jgi:hypothetical protein
MMIRTTFLFIALKSGAKVRVSGELTVDNGQWTMRLGFLLIFGGLGASVRVMLLSKNVMKPSKNVMLLSKDVMKPSKNVIELPKSVMKLSKNVIEPSKAVI